MLNSKRGLQIGLVLTAHLTAAQATSSADEAVDFQRHIAPILEARCVSCHSPGNEKGEVSLATIDDLAGHDYIVAGEPDISYVVELITAADGEPPAMPQEGDPLSSDQVELIRQWIQAGAAWPEGVVLHPKPKADATWWSLQPLSTSPPPSVDEAPDAWRRHPIDRYVYRRLAEVGLRPNQPADRRVLIRRATYDLTGLPPAPSEVEAFVHDPAPDAYERLVNRLLDSPRYGEHWGRHWLDVVRFGESRGFERNEIINNLWPFRDYVIEALNQDRPFDTLVREHVAGDALGDNRPNAEIGSAFLVAGPYDDVGNQDPAQAAQIRANTIDEMIRATSEAFLGLTVGCARCHDHKFDPILQRDYYSLYATFAGVHHGQRVVASPEAKARRASVIKPLQVRKEDLNRQRADLVKAVQERADVRAAEISGHWTRERISRAGTTESFPSVEAKYVRLVCEGLDTDPERAAGFRIDEMEVWTSGPDARNAALASVGASASGASAEAKDFAGAYGPHLAIDGQFASHFIAAGEDLTIELAKPQIVQRVVFSSARDAEAIDSPVFTFVGEYRIEVSLDGQTWREVAHGRDRRPATPAHRARRLLQAELSATEKTELASVDAELGEVEQQLAAVPPLPVVWVGERSDAQTQGPFHVFLGGNPQRLGEPVTPISLSVLSGQSTHYALPEGAPEAERRLALANWLVQPENPLTPRVLANRIWHYHFGSGIVETPNDFGYMGGRPSHPELLDWLAQRLIDEGWRLKPLHRLIMTSQTYRQASRYRQSAAKQDADARLLWRFPPRRLSAEEVRDTAVCIAGKLDLTMGGPGFRLYRYLQDNVATYVPLDEVGPETYRRAVYHQNARAAPTDLLASFDQPDCAFSAPRRSMTTTPLQALTLLNHSFTLDMSSFMADRLRSDVGADPGAQVQRAFQLCYCRDPTEDEGLACRQFIQDHGLGPLCRVLLNTSELIYVR